MIVTRLQRMTEYAIKFVRDSKQGRVLIMLSIASMISMAVYLFFCLLENPDFYCALLNFFGR